MQKNKKSEEKTQKNRKGTLLGSFFSREEPDKDYLPDLQKQWHAMGHGERIKFILGGLVGLFLFIGALLLIYLIILAIKS